MSTWVVIVNYRTSELVVDCLRSIQSQILDLAGGKVLIVDNASGDGSAEKLLDVIKAEKWQEWAWVLPQERNGGFSYGNNVGIRTAMSSSTSPEFIFLLNPDTVVRTDAVRALSDFMRANPKVGIAGSAVENDQGAIDGTAHNAPSPLGELDAGARLGILSRCLPNHIVTPPIRDVPHECDWVSGASMVVRSQVFENTGFLDEGFFLYFEEVDFCSRAKLAGWQVWYVPQARVLHLEGASTGIREKKRRPRYWYDSRLRYFVKHWGVSGLLLSDLLWAIGRASFVLRRALRLGAKKVTNDPAMYAFDLLWGDFRALIRGQAFSIKRVSKPL